MLGIALTLFAIILYIRNKKKWSILIFACFSYEGFMVLTDNVLGFKNQDASLIYFVVIWLYSYFQEKNLYYERNPQLEKILRYFFVFMICSILFSAYHYKLDFIQLIQGSRRFFIIFSFYFLRKMKLSDSYWVIRKIVYISVFTGILYIIETTVGLPVLPDSERYFSTDSIDGTLRYYNYPPALEVSLVILVFSNKLFSKKIRLISILILFIALFCTQGRALIAAVFFVSVLGLLLNSHLKSNKKYALIGAMLIIPFYPMLSERYEGDTDESSYDDFLHVIKGDFINYQGEGGTLVYRFALVSERVEYLLDRPIGEKIFGMGFISDQQTTLVRRLYHFNIGLKDKDDGYVVQLSTPDIAYGNLICKLGFMGTVLFLMIWGIMLVQSYKLRKSSQWAFYLFCLLSIYVYTSFSGATISYAEYSVIPYILLSMRKKRIYQ